MYQIMLVSCLYGLDSSPDRGDKSDRYEKENQDLQTKFLMQYPTADLSEMGHIVRMMAHIATSVMVKDRGFVSTRDVCK